MAEYYEGKLQHMNVEVIRTMTEKRPVYKVQNHQQKVVSPIKAMMILKPPASQNLTRRGTTHQPNKSVDGMPDNLTRLSKSRNLSGNKLAGS